MLIQLSGDGIREDRLFDERLHEGLEFAFPFRSVWPSSSSVIRVLQEVGKFMHEGDEKQVGIQIGIY